MSRLSLFIPIRTVSPSPRNPKKVRKLISTHYLGTRSSINDRAQTPRFPHLSVDFSPGVNTARTRRILGRGLPSVSEREKKKLKKESARPTGGCFWSRFRGLGQQTHTFSYICGSIKIRIVVESLMVGLGERVVGRWPASLLLFS